MSGSTLTTPLLIVAPWGFGAANPTYINIPILIPSQTGTTINRASFTDGFPPSTMTPEVSGGLPFFGQDMNGILYMITAYCANFAAGALSSYNSTLQTEISGYPMGAVVVTAGNDGLWINTGSTGNMTDPDTGGAGWQILAAVGSADITLTTGTVTLTPGQWTHPVIGLVGNLTGNVTVVFPPDNGRSWIVVNATTGAYTVNAKANGGTNNVLIYQTGAGAPTNIYSDGVDVWPSGTSTAGLAPLASPAFTGTPTAPTASPATSNTTQIATTAFVQQALTAALASYAALASPTLTGTPAAPTATYGTNTAQIATTAFVQAALVGQNLITAQALKVQYGSCSNAPVTFGTAFPTACVWVGLTPTGASGAGAIATFNRFGFTITGGGGNAFIWIAYGY